MNKTWKKIMIFALAVLMVAPLLVWNTYADTKAPEGYSRMYVNTGKGKTLPVRRYPDKNAEILGYASHGDAVVVDWIYAGNDGWSKILWNNSDSGYVQSRYLSATKPGSKATKTPKPTQTPAKQAEELKKKQNQLNKELASEIEVEPYYIAVRPTRATGKINFRVGPSTLTTKLTSYPANKELIVLGETTNWLRARDPENDRVGYIFREYTTRLEKQFAEITDGTEKLGKLTVNGEFDLTCKLPDDYKLQAVSKRGESITASILSDDMTKPELYLDIAYDELYGEVERMNDMTAEELTVLEETFTDLNDVDITYKETGYGTKLLVAREVGDDTDFVKILAIYKGYFIEFTMNPSSSAAEQILTDDQIQMCVDFLTDLDFVPAA